jgi:hypothetical protein
MRLPFEIEMEYNKMIADLVDSDSKVPQEEEYMVPSQSRE